MLIIYTLKQRRQFVLILTITTTLARIDRWSKTKTGSSNQKPLDQTALVALLMGFEDVLVAALMRINSELALTETTLTLNDSSSWI